MCDAFRQGHESTVRVRLWILRFVDVGVYFLQFTFYEYRILIILHFLSLFVFELAGEPSPNDCGMPLRG